MTADHTPSGSTPCRRSPVRARWESITWPGKPTAYPCVHDHAHCDFIGCVEHIDGMHVDSLGDAIVHVVCDMCRSDHTPSPATDGLREAVEALTAVRDTILRESYSGMGMVPEELLTKAEAEVERLHAVVEAVEALRDEWNRRYDAGEHMTSCPPGAGYYDLLALEVDDMLQDLAHPAPPSETATEGEQIAAMTVEYGIRGEQDSPCRSREAAEKQLERFRKGPYRVRGRTLIRRVVGEWEPVEETHP